MINALGVVGLGTMGANLARNAARNKATVAIFNRTTERTDEFMRRHGKEGTFVACATPQALVQALPKPRAILLMVSAGKAVDDVIEEFVPLLENGDILIDGGNSQYRDTERRCADLEKKGIRFIGMGVSGGEEGALHGPSMMPGGDRDAFELLKPLLTSMAADDGSGGACVSYMGPGGAGHFVKTVHNGIEYAVMQLIAETYDILRDAGRRAPEIAEIFHGWLNGDLESFLMDSTVKVLGTDDADTGKPLVDVIKDVAKQKGTGKWTVDAALEYGVAVPTIAAGVDARLLSGRKAERTRWSKEFPESLIKIDTAPEKIPALLRPALECATMIAYAQGFDLLAAASRSEKWDLPIQEIARIWKGGCIIRSTILDLFQQATGGIPDEEEQGKKAILKRLAGTRQMQWRHIVSIAVSRGVPVPAFASTVTYFDALRSERLPQNLIQGQRDYFGAHGFERTDKEGVYHGPWHSSSSILP
jgi:6-phosphogluconate dehydrogenase